MLLEQKVLSFQGKPLFQRAKFKTPFEVSGSMDDMACFFYMVEGAYEIFDPHGSMTIGPQQALIKKCGNYVAHLKEGNWDGIVIFFYPEVLHEIYKHEPPSFMQEPYSYQLPKHQIGNELLDKFIQGLFLYFDNPSLMNEELALLKIKELILLLLRSEQQDVTQQFIRELFTPEKLHFTSVIESNLFSRVSMEELAFICHKSLSSFKREFRKIYNSTPARYIKQRRLEFAAQLLTSTDQSITNIAFEVGFQDVTTFSASFREKFNFAPTQYRLNQTRK